MGIAVWDLPHWHPWGFVPKSNLPQLRLLHQKLAVLTACCNNHHPARNQQFETPRVCDLLQ